MKKKKKAEVAEHQNKTMCDGYKPVKIRSYGSSRKYGFAVKSVKELLDKGCKSLPVRPLMAP